MNRLTWTEERKARLGRLWDDGVPAEQIASCFGVSTEAIRKQAYKLGLGRRFDQHGKPMVVPQKRTPPPAHHAKPPVVVERKEKKCLRCRETFVSQHAAKNWICPECAPIVNRLRAAIA